ncbi:hypothetical protein [Paracidovorax anthurii]|uniref:Uncharacterized protein n=1 Tax=Paracidovorax anthurii TaxID=78229 RepID=A0A328ZKU4_9BURK|nr:hypothetical protein [Paracidovorax anthurii]RAR86531.1 hypothetical protein AX018_1001117 [Paracidovorax anthurii]
MTHISGSGSRRPLPASTTTLPETGTTATAAPDSSRAMVRSLSQRVAGSLRTLVPNAATARGLTRSFSACIRPDFAKRREQNKELEKLNELRQHGVRDLGGLLAGVDVKRLPPLPESSLNQEDSIREHRSIKQKAKDKEKEKAEQSRRISARFQNLLQAESSRLSYRGDTSLRLDPAVQAPGEGSLPGPSVTSAPGQIQEESPARESGASVIEIDGVSPGRPWENV